MLLSKTEPISKPRVFLLQFAIMGIRLYQAYTVVIASADSEISSVKCQIKIH